MKWVIPRKFSADWQKRFAWEPTPIADRDGHTTWVWLRFYDERCLEERYYDATMERRCGNVQGTVTVYKKQEGEPHGQPTQI